jgi:putative acyl-CoA dehydrogenase
MPLARLPMMANVLADLAVEVEAATLLALRVAKATDRLDDAREAALARVATPVAKFFNCSRAPAVAYEALQCHGGNGFVEEHPIARLYREAPLNSVWEGTANMMCMDVRRALRKDRTCGEALMDELARVRGESAAFDRFVGALPALLDGMLADEYLARPACEAIARALQGAELVRHATPEVVGAFLATRVEGRGAGGAMFGTLGMEVPRAQADAIVERARVVRG